MKKVLAVFLAILTVFSVMTISVYAEEDNETPAAEVVTEKEEKTTRNILNDDGLVVPVNETQLKFAFVFKIVEKIVKFVLGIFGKDVDDAIAGGINEFGKWIDEAISNLSDGLAD